jgi:predicted metalloprotease with PDZ domain
LLHRNFAALAAPNEICRGACKILMQMGISRDGLGHILDAVADQSSVSPGREVVKMRTTSQMAPVGRQRTPLARLPLGSDPDVYMIGIEAKSLNKKGSNLMPVLTRRLFAASLACSIVPAAHAAPATPVATVEVDARDAPRGIERVHLVLPVKPGKLTLLYPKWLPGDHAPDGPVAGISGLKFSSKGQSIAWQRDADDMYAFHLAIPSGAGALDVAFEVDAVAGATDNNALRTSTESLSLILWNQLVLYPAGARSDDLQYSANLRLPAGWNFGTALPRVSSTADTTQFAAVSLTTLIDSPVLSGRHFKTVDLGGTPSVYLHLAADSDAALGITPATTAQLRKLVQEAAALFGAAHYSEYHFLWTLSDQISFEGIEHHQSSDNRSSERSLVDEELRHSGAINELLPHEYTHSWNGKYRRPIGLATGNYDSPMRGELLWVYEGLTEYIGMVLSARSGFATLADARDSWAGNAAWLQTRKGREWRSLADTAVAAQFGYTQAPGWRGRTRSTDFYIESAMLWLEADTLIRSTTHGAKSLDDFCRLFYGPPSTAPKVIPYDFNDVVKALNTVMPYDWHGFWTERLHSLRPNAPLEGLAAGGWRLVFDPEPTLVEKGNSAAEKLTNLYYSLGIRLKDDGAAIIDVMPGTPADDAGLAPDSNVIAIDGRKYSKDVLADALKAGGDAPRVLNLLVQKDDTYKTVEVHYAGHARHPRLERDAATPDLLTPILSPRTGS